MKPYDSWAACSSACGGGTQARSRQVKRPPRHGGLACPVGEERRSCNMQACDAPCELGEWTAWGKCSRTCSFGAEASEGRQSQVKAIVEPGAGKCPAADAKERFRDQTCNERPCSENSTCTGEQDIILLLDGSDIANFDAQLQLALGIVSGSSAAMRFGVVAYGSKPMVLSSLSDSRSKLQEALASAKAPGGDPDLAAGEAVVRSLILATGFGPGRAGPRTVVLLTDGAPTDFAGAHKVALELRAEGVRLLVGLVGSSLKQNACSLVGEPCDVNVELARKWEELSTQPLRFLAALCDELIAPPSPPPSEVDRIQR